MKRSMRLKVLMAAMAMVCGLSACTSTGTQTTAYSSTLPQNNRSDAQIYMFRGGFNGVFSTGITDMATELRRRGVPAQDLSWAASNASLDKIRKSVAANPQAGPIILAGHSLGASSVIGMARKLTREDIEVDLVIVFDPLGSTRVPKGVRKLINFKASGKKSNPGGFEPGPGFNGEIVNVDIRNLPDLDQSGHFNIVNQAALQRRVIREIESEYVRFNRRGS